MCELKKSSRFEAGACEAARRRNLYRAYCAAHASPHGKLSPLDANAPPSRCPFCPAAVLTHAFEAKEFR
eukprot:1782861-Pleurochrysis_carterae.AAC.1